MRRVTRNGVIAIAAASGAMAVTFPAYADSAADGAAADSPGVLSGNTVQVPVHVPVNVCGNTVNVVGLLNPTVGNKCVNEDAGAKSDSKKEEDSTSATSSVSGSKAEGVSTESGGIGSGNVIQLPVHVPVNVTGNSVNVIGAGNAAIENESANVSGEETPVTTLPAPEKAKPAAPEPRSMPPAHVPHEAGAVLAHTGADATASLAAGATALVLGGAVLYRRFRTQAVR